MIDRKIHDNRQIYRSPTCGMGGVIDSNPHQEVLLDWYIIG